MVESRCKAICGPKTHIDDLPDECLVHIMRSVDRDECLPMSRWQYGMHAQHPLQCAFVCKRWHALASYAVHSLHLSHFTVEIAQDMGNRFTCLTELKFSSATEQIMPDSALIALAHLTPQLEHLETGTQVAFTAPAMVQALTMWTRLRRLIMGGLFTSLSSEEFHSVLDVVCKLPSLKHLDFYYRNDDLAAVCVRVGGMTGLATLKFGCRSVPPVSAGRLREVLRELELFTMEGTTLPDSLGLLSGLEALSIMIGKQLTALPECLGRLQQLTSLVVYDCPKLPALPTTLGQLTRLKALKVVTNSGRLQIWPASFWNLRGLQTLEILRPGKVWQTQGCLPSLGTLIFRKFNRLPKAIGNLPSLRKLEVRDGAVVSELPGWLGHLSSLEVFRLHDLPSLALLPEALGRLTALKELSLSNCCGQMQVLPHSLRHLVRLETCKLRGLLSLQRLPNTISKWCTLECLEVMDCPALRSLPEGLIKCDRLKTLKVSGCEQLVSLPKELGQLSALTRLTLLRCSSLPGLPRSIGSLSRLEFLDLSHCGRLTKLPSTVTELCALRCLLVQHCDSLEPLADSLEQLRLSSLRWV